MRAIVEICCGSYEDALSAQNGGADRIELNSALHLGGLTPSLASLKCAKKACTIPIICMVRPRGAGFCYNEKEIEVMFEDAKILLDNGCDGIAFGFLNEDRTINQVLTKKMCELIHSYQKEAVFHRAFDCVKDPYEAIEQLIRIGIDRILTSGLEATAPEGEELIAELTEKYQDQIEILAGSGIKAHNVKDFIKKTKIRQVHSSAKCWRQDLTTTANHVSYAYHEAFDYDAVSEEAVKELMNAVK